MFPNEKAVRTIILKNLKKQQVLMFDWSKANSNTLELKRSMET